MPLKWHQGQWLCILDFDRRYARNNFFRPFCHLVYSIAQVHLVITALWLQMFKDPRVMLQLMGVELDQKMDFCVDVDIPVPPLSIDFFPPQHYLFMVGPVPLSLGKSHTIIGKCLHTCTCAAPAHRLLFTQLLPYLYSGLSPTYPM